MKILIKFFLAAFLVSPSFIFAQGVTISGVEGIVQVRVSPNEDWKAAYTGMEVSEGGSIRTGERSRASIKFPNKSAIWLKENTSLAFKESKERSNHLDLEGGEIKFRVPHLKWKEKFNISSGKTVASVRGTEGVVTSAAILAIKIQKIMSLVGTVTAEAAESMGGPSHPVAHDPSEKTENLQVDIEKGGDRGPVLHVLFGEVDVKLVTDSGQAIFDVKVAQGTKYTSPLIEGLEKAGVIQKGGKDGKDYQAQAVVNLLTPEEEKEGQKSWEAGLTEQERGAAQEAKIQAREMIRTFAEDIKVRNQEVKEQTVQVKEEDFATGRTLTDVHGNIVRVDQRLDRTENTIQVINVVKRTNGYSAGGLRAYAYNGSAGNRVDAVITKIVFNTNLPDQINEFPGFFSEKGESVKVDKVQMVMANQTDGANVFAIGFFGRRDSASGTDNIDSDLYIGTLGTSGGTTGKQKLFTLDIDSSRAVSGMTRFVEDTTIARTSVEGMEGELYSREATRWQQQGDSTSKLWLVTENFVINNSGKVKNVSDFTNSSSNFETLLKESAGEMILMAKTNVSNAPSAVDATNFAGGNSAKNNIDVVIIPDLGVSIIKSIATSFDKFKTTY